MPATPYVTPQSLIDAFGETEIVELTDRAAPRADVVDLAVAQRGCDRAIAEVDGFLRARYTLPLASVPVLVPYLALDLARYYLYETTAPDIVTRRYDAARKTLTDIQSGKQPLGIDATGVDVASTPTDLAEFCGGDKVFGRRDA